jgi:hypothetical protein
LLANWKSDPGWYKLGKGNRVYVFVHGILSNCEDCFSSELNDFWPQIAHKDEPEASVFLCNYYSMLWAGEFTINHAADLLSADLQSSWICQDGNCESKSVLDFEEIVFICHSMGGLVIKDLLCRNDSLFEDKRLKIVFCSTPSMGSRLMRGTISHLCKMLKFKQALQLGFNSPTIQAIDEGFVSYVSSRARHDSIVGMELVENMPTRIFGPLKVRVVTEQSGKRYAELFSGRGWVGYIIPDATHSTICKPRNAESRQQTYLRTFIRTGFKQPGLRKRNDHGK